MVIFLDAFPDVGEEPAGLLLVRLLCGLGLVDDLCTLGARHCDGVLPRGLLLLLVLFWEKERDRHSTDGAVR